MPKNPRPHLIGYGIYIGKDKSLGTPVFWNIRDALNPHALIVGPTGSGKTELLMALALRIHSVYDIPVLFIDVKGDIESRLRARGFTYRVLRPGIDSLGILYPLCTTPKYRAIQISNAIIQCWGIDKYSKLSYVIHSVLSEGFELCKRPAWNDLVELARSRIRDYVEAIALVEILEILKTLDPHGFDTHPLVDLGNEILVLSLKLIPRERIELINFVSLIMFQDLINRISALNVDSREIRAVIGVDEIWLTMQLPRDSGLLLSLLRLSRGYGVSVLMTTQSFSDLGPNYHIYLDNVSLLAIMGGSSKKFLKSVRNFMRLTDDDVERLSMIMGQGDAVIRILPDPRPVVVSVDIEDLVS